MQELLTLRRKGQDISQSPMGFLCRGRKLELGGEGEAPVVSSTSEDEVATDVETGTETGGDMEDKVGDEMGEETGAETDASTPNT